MPDLKDLIVKYPSNFEPPGPAKQQELTIEVMETFLIDYEDDYNNGPTNGLEPEEWVELRHLYACIHWMYMQLVGEEQPHDSSE